MYLNPWAVGSVLAAIAVGLVFGAEPVFAHSTPDSFGRKIAEFMLQLALIVIIGALINFPLRVILIGERCLNRITRSGWGCFGGREPYTSQLHMRNV